MTSKMYTLSVQVSKESDWSELFEFMYNTANETGAGRLRYIHLAVEHAVDTDTISLIMEIPEEAWEAANETFLLLAKSVIRKFSDLELGVSTVLVDNRPVHIQYPEVPDFETWQKQQDLLK